MCKYHYYKLINPHIKEKIRKWTIRIVNKSQPGALYEAP